MTNARQIAFLALRDVHKGAYADFALDKVLQKFKLQDTDRRLVTELVYGSVRRQRTLDALIDQFAKKKSHQQPKELRTILHLGLYQLCYQERIPASAAVNTTVQLAKENGFAGLTGFVNGLLRQYIRQAEGDEGDKGDEGEKFISSSSSASRIPLQLPDNPGERLGILHSFPDWIIQVWLEQLSIAETEQLCEWMNQSPTIDLRINPLRCSIEEVEAALQSADILVRRIPHLPQALRLISNSGPIQNLPGFREGWWVVQDSSAQLVSHLLDPQPGEVVIDACAAPGGKTTHIAELMGDKGKIWACDRTASRLKKLQENTKRLNLQSIEICTGDSREFLQFQNTGDRVLLDAPCSGLGTLHRHADARWRQTPETVQELSQLQTELLSHTATFVKSGGVLVYATCTLHPLENEAVISQFLANSPDWQIEPPQKDSPAFAYSTPEGWCKVWPHRQDMDGFFMVRLRKTNNSE
ncbi:MULTISPECIES: 16S rRNA (cytosine(967)-C(5))-methyltransferase [unclassified Tolypothrix]|uniref:16S rRNA (cytosine(967)-C(5))-methyltransferase n=1 Tax=unclassified Tolypothrix TaxID=2649714 RepID=UPI0005EAB42D|nr:MULTISPECIES: 16S rRNA (cytosine(967)-C(5))-methyltransferase [unclassified Tolypothrix]BAY93115.1 sun protein [Microchaete diplosiphon NIES-3275]EKF00369.1 rRNA SAM-dependent protein [Tolypothrix sp. PCC 7601]MBE9081864.1 16S rRNA (cytosine(967)-C(5))-methyltransferase [Tolypothrix sp. LEGE 11397]UYD26993.1 16S rRNA (cytosine(967)-C(5))-methyltransferase [Tolypothrix sp. PCC 7712]UYD37148.1 16S rRNA (cytosine(967)-C(5))-methyltransferase [Tolypothrix sp. PCC 7601]